MKKQLLSLCLALAVVAPTASAMNTVFADTQENTFSVTETKTIDLEAAYEEKLANFEYVDPYYDTWELSYDVRPYEKYSGNDNLTRWGFKFKVDGQDFVVYMGHTHINVAFLNESGKLGDATGDGLSIKIDTNAFWGKTWESYSTTRSVMGAKVNKDFQTFTGADEVISGNWYNDNYLAGSNKTNYISTKTYNWHINADGKGGTSNYIQAKTMSSQLKKETLSDGTEEYHYYQDGRYACTLTFADEVDGVAPYINDNHPANCMYTTKDVAVEGTDTTEKVHDVENCTYEYVSNVALTPNVVYTVDDEKAKTMDDGLQMAVGDKMSFTHTGLQNNGGKDGAGVSFTLGEQAFAFNSGTANTYWHLTEIGKSYGDGQAANAYIKALNGYKYTKEKGQSVGIATAAGQVHSISGQSSEIVNQVYSTTRGRQFDNRNRGLLMTFNIIRRENITVDEVEYEIYEFSVMEETGILQFGFPVTSENNGVKVAPFVSKYQLNDSRLSDYTYVSANTENNVKAPAASTGDVNDFVSYTGAEIRTAIDQEGLRFITTIDKKIVKAYQEIYGESNVEFGVKLTRETDGAFVYAAADKYKEVDGKYVIQVAITDLPEGNYTASYTPQVYIAYRTGETATGCTCVIGDKLTENARSIAFVAQKALEDTSNVFTENQITLLKKFAGITE